MNPFAVFLTICSLGVSQAYPTLLHGGGGGGGGGSIQLEGVPDNSNFGTLNYPSLNIIPLGSAIQGSLPPAVVEINKKVIIKEPQPYPVKISVPVPHPVEVPKPYPVVETKIVKVPVPQPIEVVRKIPVPFEVPKPYPVPSQEGNVGSYGSSFTGAGIGHLALNNDIQEEANAGVGYDKGFEGANGGGYADADQSGSYGAQLEPSQNTGYEGGFEGSASGYAQADQSGSYGTQAEASQGNAWVPVDVQVEQQQIEEHHQ